jgi:hypothetical protein
MSDAAAGAIPDPISSFTDRDVAPISADLGDPPVA